MSQRIAQRIAIIELMAAAMLQTELQNNEEYKELRNDIISHFFQSLTLRSEPIIAVARKSLEQDGYCDKLPKDLLKQTLR
ncbi:hypothetical protein M1146_05540 [Patescibacteria group bacterium]|nr:hypothetical protein [Patescibacteria group bacterium]